MDDLITVALDQPLYMRVRAYTLKQSLATQERITLQTVIDTWLRTFLERHPEPQQFQPAETDTITRTKMSRTHVAQVRVYALQCENTFHQPVRLRTVLEYIIRQALDQAEQTAASPPDSDVR